MGKKKNGKLIEISLQRLVSSPLKYFLEFSHLTLEEKKVITVAEIVQLLIKAQDEKRDVNLNALKTRISSKYGLGTSPRLVDIIAAVPINYRKTLVPKLLAKPIRTASGVSHFFIYVILSFHVFTRLQLLP